MKRALLAILITTSACAPTRGTAFEKDRAEAWRAFVAGRFSESALRYEQAAKDAKVERDRYFMRYEAAVAWIRAGDVPRGEQILIDLTKTDNAYAPQAALKLTELVKTDEERYAALEKVCLRFPDDGVAIVAALRVVHHDDEIDPGHDRAIAHMQQLATQTKGKKVEQTFAWERAKRLEARGKTEEARDAYLDVAARFPYPFGSYFDDTLYRASFMDEKLGRPKEAIADLERLLDKHETSTFLGTYERPKYVPSLLRIAGLYEEPLKDHEKARAALHRLYVEFPNSPFRDDALWREAALYQADGDAKSSCDRLKTLTSDFPDSRYVPCAVTKCPSLSRPSKSKAPATCHTYIERGEGASHPENALEESKPKLPETSP